MMRMPPELEGRIQTCMRLSLDSRLGIVAGTTPVPCRDVTTKLVPPCISTLSTGAQSIPWQHSIGYQSCALAGVATDIAIASRRAETIVRDMMCLLAQRLPRVSPPSRPMLFVFIIIPLRRSAEDNSTDAHKWTPWPCSADSHPMCDTAAPCKQVLPLDSLPKCLKKHPTPDSLVAGGQGNARARTGFLPTASANSYCCGSNGCVPMGLPSVPNVRRSTLASA